MSKLLAEILELAEQHAEDSRGGKRLSDSGLETLADEVFWNAIFPILENRGADAEDRVKGATFEQHYTKAFIAAYRAPKQAKKPAKKSAKKAKPKPPVRGLLNSADPKGATLKAVKDYLATGADVNELLEYGEVFMESMLHLAAASHLIPIMKYLLEHGADPKLPNGTTGETPLHAAINKCDDDPAPVALLLDHGADPNGKALNGGLPLHDAILTRQPKTIELLLARGADPKRTIRFAQRDLDALQLCNERGEQKLRALVARRR